MRLAGALPLALGLLACGEAGDDAAGPALRLAGGDAERGRVLVAQHDCGVCHVVPGLRGARGRVGPSLAGFGGRGYVAGVLPNTPDNLVWWLRDPPAVAPRTAMPDLGLDAEEARHIAAYLVTLR